MLNLFQHLVISTCYETLKRVQGDTIGLFTTSSIVNERGFPINPGMADLFITLAASGF
jgi:hypothetical protein